MRYPNRLKRRMCTLWGVLSTLIKNHRWAILTMIFYRILCHSFCLTIATSCVLLAETPDPSKAFDGYALVFHEDFEKGIDHWEVVDAESWTHRTVEGNAVFGINRRESSYAPVHRSPLHIALVKDLEIADFIITFKVRSTKDTGNHRDCCVFFNYRDASKFYYCHLGAKPDPASGQIMIVNDAPRSPITQNTKTVPWDDQWHQVKVVRDTASGKIDVFFDDMTKPQLSAVDKTFAKGRIGIGSFDDMNDFDEVLIYERN